LGKFLTLVYVVCHDIVRIA